MMTELEYAATKIKIERGNEEKLKHYPILEKQLKIAVEALKYIYDDTKKGHTQCDACGYCSSCETCINAEWAEKALNQIKDLEK